MNEEKLEEVAAEDAASAEEAESEQAEAEAADVRLGPEEIAEIQQQLSDLEATLEEVEGKLKEAEDKAAEYLDGWQRTQASFANYRKRTEGEQKQWRSAANAQLLSRILPIIDDFKRAFESMPESLEDNAWLSGIRLIRRKLESILQSENVKTIEVSSGDTFDPKYHEAILFQEVEGFEEGEIVAEVETGYMLGNRVLRPSMVVVAKESTKAAEKPVDTAVEERAPVNPEGKQEESTEDVFEVEGEIVEGSKSEEDHPNEDEETKEEAG
ncbi:MAG: nucleotide exchange factor GrpE [Anaerolineae bacterium]